MRIHEREAVHDLLVAVELMIEAHEDLMPGIKAIAVQDYALHNDAPRQAKQAVAKMRKILKGGAA